MVKRFLITTALEDTWRDDVPVLFLGEWCRLHSRRARWSAMDAEVMPYHWDDRAKLQRDYADLQVLNERLLKDLTGQLNEIHGVDHGVRYWRIFVGPWLGYFIQILFDRWESIQQAVRRYELSETVVLQDESAAAVPNDMAEFARILHGDTWNHRLYGAILREFTGVSCVTRPGSLSMQPIGAPPANAARLRRTTLASLYVRAAGLLSRDDDVFCIGTSLRALDEMGVYRRLGQTPQHWVAVPPPGAPIDAARRTWVVRGDSRSDFERCARTLIPRQIPAIYLEGYRRLLQEIESLPWPRRPAAIWTSHAGRDDVLQAWMADKVERGTPLVISQHGGHYGLGRWSFHEDHEIAISDRYLTWGWSDPAHPKVAPVGIVTAKRPLRVRHASQSRALLVTATVPRYSYWMYSIMVGPQWLDYFEDQVAFVEHVSSEVRDALTVRLYGADYGWDQRARWTERSTGVRLDDGVSDLEALLRQCRLYIATYNATTFLESYAMDVPTVTFWNPRHWEFRDSVLPYFDELKRVGLFHDTPEGAAQHVSAIWSDVDAWWSSHPVVDARARFMGRYGLVHADLLDRIAGELRRATRARPVARLPETGHNQAAATRIET